MPMMRKRRVKLSEQVRQAMARSGLSRYAICKVGRIDQATLCRFAHGKITLSMPTLDKLADVLDLDIVAGEPMHVPRGRPGRPKKPKE